MKKLGFLLVCVMASVYALSADDEHRRHGKKGMGDMHSPAQMIKHMDTDKDGKISKQEWQDFHDKRFAEMDADKDGFVTADEMKAAREQMMKKHRQKMKDDSAKSKKQRSKKQKSTEDDSE